MCLNETSVKDVSPITVIIDALLRLFKLQALHLLAKSNDMDINFIRMK